MNVTEKLPLIVSLKEIKGAQQRIKGKVNRTPLIRLYPDNFPGEIYLKLENLQPIGFILVRVKMLNPYL